MKLISRDDDSVSVEMSEQAFRHIYAAMGELHFGNKALDDSQWADFLLTTPSTAKTVLDDLEGIVDQLNA